MINVLIPTKSDDVHALYVKFALKQKGHRATLWFTSDFPSLQTHTWHLTKDQCHWQPKGTEFEDYHHFDVVWLRRPSKPVLPLTLHPDDIENASNENNAMFNSFWQLIAPKAVWINPMNKLAAVNSKLLQLKVAANIGFNIPETLLSNDPEEIKIFINNHHDIVYKSLCPMYWYKDNKMRMTYTKKITHKNLPINSILQATPGIFQHKIPKAYELRITYFDQYYIAAKIYSQNHPRGKTDWRFIPTNELEIEPVELPKSIHKKCISFMKHFGLQFGCFDFIVTPNDAYYFLEINEQGQFLWIEEVNPNIKMLDTLCNFLIKSGGDTTYNPGIISMRAYQKEVLAVISVPTKEAL